MFRKSQIEIETMVKIALYGALTLALLAILYLIGKYLIGIRVFG